MKTSDRRRFIRLSAIGAGLAAVFGLGTGAGMALRECDEEQVTMTGDEITLSGLRTYPYLDYSVTLTSGVGWAWSPWREIIPTGAIRNDFEIHGIYLSGNDIEGVIELAIGEPGNERTIAELPSKYTAGTIGASGLIFFPWSTKVPAKSRVAARYTVGFGTEVRSDIRILYREARVEAPSG